MFEIADHHISAADDRLPHALCWLIWLALGCIAWGGLFLLGEMVGRL